MQNEHYAQGLREAEYQQLLDEANMVNDIVADRLKEKDPDYTIESFIAIYGEVTCNDLDDGCTMIITKRKMKNW